MATHIEVNLGGGREWVTLDRHLQNHCPNDHDLDLAVHAALPMALENVVRIREYHRDFTASITPTTAGYVKFIWPQELGPKMVVEWQPVTSSLPETSSVLSCAAALVADFEAINRPDRPEIQTQRENLAEALAFNNAVAVLVGKCYASPVFDQKLASKIAKLTRSICDRPPVDTSKKTVGDAMAQNSPPSEEALSPSDIAVIQLKRWMDRVPCVAHKRAA